MDEEKDKSNIPKETTLEEKINNRNAVLDTDELVRVAEFIKDFNPKKDKYKRTLEAQGYVAARRSYTGNYSHIAKALGLPYGEFKYYLETKPEFSAAIRQGIIDGKNELKNNLIDTLVNKALGQVTEDVTVTEEYNYKSNIPAKTKVTKLRKEIPPDTQAILKLLEQLDPEWRPKTTLDVNIENDMNINVTENRIATIDLANLSPQALEEILISQSAGENTLANKREDGKSVRMLKDTSDDVIIDVVDKPKRKMSEETKQKIRDAYANRRKVKEQKREDIETKMKAEDINNGE